VADVQRVASPWPAPPVIAGLAQRVLASTLRMLTRPRTPLARGVRAAFLMALMLAAPGRAANAPAPLTAYPPPTSLPTLAKEDTIRLATGALPEVVVTAPRITLDEILRRVARGEARRDSIIRDQAFTATVRMVKGSAGNKPQLVSETVTRVYKKKPDMVREIVLRRWTAWKNKNGDDDVNIDFTPSTAERVVSFAFSPELRDQFRYSIAGREIVGGHVVYRIHFEPRSDVSPLAPRGEVWIDTNEFVILRQETTFDRSPVPLFLKSIDRFVVERVRDKDGLWVVGRILMRMQLTIPVPRIGSSFDLAILLGDYATNAGIEDAFFAQPGGRHVAGRGDDD